MRKLVSVMSAVLAAAVVSPVAQAAEPAAVCSDEPRDLPIHEFTDYRELQVELARLARVSKGRVQVAVAGRSNRGRTIFRATVGTGPKVILLSSEIHGNEKTGTDALLRILDYLGTSESG